jgi:acyl-CoA reductase-like NAD-dependent aldehyde dehydrogenase
MKSRNWIGGQWITPKGGEVTVRNPSDPKEEVGLRNLSQEADVIEAGSAARQSHPEWASLTGAQRGEILYRVAQLMEQRLDELATLSSSEMGKPISEMRGEVMRGIHLLRYYAAEGVRSNGNVIPANASNVLQYTQRVSLGVVGIITPWNFPVAIPIWKIAPALITGNTIVWKPAEIASLSATIIAELFAEAQLPAGVFNLVIGKGRVIGDTMLNEIELDGVSFTGSTSTGQRVASLCAKRNIKYQTEMGGKNAAVVLGDADLSLTVPTLISGAFRSAGQKCTATSRIIVEKEQYEPLTEALSEAMESVKTAPALDPKAYLGPVASKSQHESVTSYFNMAKQEGQVVVEGTSDVDPESGHYVLPLIVSGVDVTHSLVQEEVFGPLATILPAEDIEEAIELSNQTVFGLSASIFTRDLTKAHRFLDEAQAGMVRVNLETAGVEYQAPFGGMKMSSSHTREQGQAALDFYTQVKTCAVYYGG